ncbi:hypothetical protein EHS25_001291 [Saitozyma podzolica]|uniref:Mitochondrial carrier protein ymc2 n=1 Tax=Saitozyma podzolica TaxID=1890683 RepID=A0A427YHX3_9TREE|nr:hypothetical protein EHS25_001291 [Saitozyma podzolica]
MTRIPTPPASEEPEVGGFEPPPDRPEGNQHHPYAGFAAGICSGWTKLVVGHPFDTIKTRLQCAPRGTYQGAWHCFTSTISKEGPRALYKGASIPAISWGITDSILMGSLHNYRAYLKTHGFAEPNPYASRDDQDPLRLSLLGHTVAGLFAGWTNASVAHPTEIIKCKLQLQLVQPAHVPKEFKGPIDVVRKTISAQGITGMWKGLGASFLYRSSFLAMFGGLGGTSWGMSKEMANFLAGGMASNLYWGMALPMDNVKNRIMTDSVTKPRYHGVFDAYRQTWTETFDPTKTFGWNSAARIKNFYRGVVPVVLRAFPTNAAALAVWEAVMRYSTRS